jgi:hypothetical protein
MAKFIGKVQSVLARSLPKIELWESEYADSKKLPDEISWLGREDKREEDQITDRIMYAPVVGLCR